MLERGLSFLNTPNIPEKKIKVALVDKRIESNIQFGFAQRGIETIKLEGHSGLYPAISSHPDAIFHHLGGNLIIHAPGADKSVLSTLEELGFLLIEGEAELTRKYPGTIYYNVARVGNLAFHNTKYTDKKLKELLYRLDIELVHVNQGYAKCAVSVVDENSIITMDRGIARIAQKKGLDVLVIEEERILLPGFANGFIGGSTCLIDKKVLAVFGNIHKLKSAAQIINFLLQKDTKLVSLSEEPVIDIGSVIPLLTE
ncbi:MAG: hypothetical protein GX992_07825 [Clostridium sp.]|nr:hypothetical protein [Clostridium sp.]